MRRIVRRAPRGMSLIEIMVVLVIMGMIATLIGWNVVRMKREADIQVATIDIRHMKSAVIAHRLKTNRFPDSLDELVGIEIETAHADPWGTPWLYEVNGETFAIRSAGPDRTANTADDVSIEQSPPAQARH